MNVANDFDERWKEMETTARERFEDILREGKRAWRKREQPAVKKKNSCQSSR